MKNDNVKKDEEPNQVFQGFFAKDRSNFLSRLTFSFIEPLLSEAQTEDVCFDQLGELPEYMNI